eukprot:1642585-Rhodomonas_salina.1
MMRGGPGFGRGCPMRGAPGPGFGSGGPMRGRGMAGPCWSAGTQGGNRFGGGPYARQPRPAGYGQAGYGTDCIAYDCNGNVVQCNACQEMGHFMHDCKKWIAFQESQGGSSAAMQQPQPAGYAAATAAAEEYCIWDGTRAAEQQQQYDWSWDLNAYYDAWFDQNWNDPSTNGGGQTAKGGPAASSEIPTPTSEFKQAAMHATTRLFDYVTRELDATQTPKDNNSEIETIDETTQALVFSMLMLFVNAVCFTSQFWFDIMLRIVYTCAKIAANLCPWQNSRALCMCSMRLRTGTTLYSYTNPRSPCNNTTEPEDENDPPSTPNDDMCHCQQAMLNSVTSETIQRMFAASDKDRKTSLNVAPTALANHIVSDVPPKKDDEMLCVADSGANRHFIPEARYKQYMFR